MLILQETASSADYDAAATAGQCHVHEERIVLQA